MRGEKTSAAVILWPPLSTYNARAISKATTGASTGVSRHQDVARVWIWTRQQRDGGRRWESTAAVCVGVPTRQKSRRNESYEASLFDDENAHTHKTRTNARSSCEKAQKNAPLAHDQRVRHQRWPTKASGHQWKGPEFGTAPSAALACRARPGAG